ncbi:MAG TPA: FCD domain-containing protein [Pseudonocardia sp.]|jgi:DNA-binding FadR family transcriptional regulator
MSGYSGYEGRGVHGQTVATLGARIVSGAVPPGAVLDLAELGRELDLSMTALREALKVLAAKGLVAARQRRGTYVRDRADWNLLDGDVLRWRGEAGETATVLRELAEVRASVEPAAAALAATRREDADLAELDAALADMAGAADAAARVAADLRWHRALLRATHNELFARMDVFLAPGLRLRDALVHAGEADDPVPGHAAVVAAVRAGDGGAAAAATRRLLEASARDAEAALRTGGVRA